MLLCFKINYAKVLVPDMRADCCLGPERMWSAWGKGAREGPPPRKRGRSSQCSVGAETTWTRTRKDRQVGCDEEGSAWTEWAIFCHRMRNHLVNVNYVDELNLMFVLFQENKSYGIKTICIDPLSTRCCTSQSRTVPFTTAFLCWFMYTVLIYSALYVHCFFYNNVFQLPNRTPFPPLCELARPAGWGFEYMFYSPERPFMHFPVCCWFLISSEIEPGRSGAGPGLMGPWNRLCPVQ